MIVTRKLQSLMGYTGGRETPGKTSVLCVYSPFPSQNMSLKQHRPYLPGLGSR